MKAAEFIEIGKLSGEGAKWVLVPEHAPNFLAERFV